MCIFTGPLTFKNEEGRYSVIGVVSFGPKTCVDPGERLLEGGSQCDQMIRVKKSPIVNIKPPTVNRV